MNSIQGFASVQNNKAVPLTERVAEQINQLILEKNLKPGDKIPNEFELGKLLDVSRNTVREAIKLLVSRNIVEIRRGKGTFICSQVGIIDDPLGLAYMEDSTRLAREVLEVREYLEPWVAAKAAQNASEEDLEKLHAACLAVEEKLVAGEPHLEEDKRFHTCLAECTHNRIIPKLYPIVMYGVVLFGALYSEEVDDNRDFTESRKMTIITHREILEAVEAHDSVRAEIASRAHLKGNKERLKTMEASSK